MESAEDSSNYIRLISADGHVFFVERSRALISPTIRAMLEGSFTESRGEIRFPEISTHVLEKVIQYFHYKARFAGSSAPIPEYPIEPEVALELLMAANYLDC